MIDRAEREHFRTESLKSLNRQHALMYLRAKQIKNLKQMKYMAKVIGKKEVAKAIAGHYTRKRKAVRRKRGMFDNLF